MKGRGVRLLRSASRSVEMKAAASEKKNAMIGTTTLNRSHHGTLAMTGRRERPANDGTLASEEGKRLETLVTIETTGT